MRMFSMREGGEWWPIFYFHLRWGKRSYKHGSGVSLGIARIEEKKKYRAQFVWWEEGGRDAGIQ